MWRYFFLPENTKIRWRFSVGVTLYTVLIFVFLEPLKGDIVSYNYPLHYNLYAFLGNFLVILTFCILIPALFPSFFDREVWNLKRFLIWFTMITLAIITFGLFFDFLTQDIADFKTWAIAYFTSYIPPIASFISLSVLAFFILYNPAHLIKPQNNHTSALIDKEALSDEMTTLLTNNNLILFDINNQKVLEIPIDDFYYMQPSRNYIEVFYQKKEETSTINGLNRILIRNTLKSIEEQCKDIPQIFRCHNTYIVNTDKVVAITGNAKAYTLILTKSGVEVPVSRQKKQELENRFPRLI